MPESDIEERLRSSTEVPLNKFLSFPSKIQIQTINRCNFSCSMCPYPNLTALENKVQLNSDLFRRLIDEAQALKRKIKLCLMLQNEPLLDHNFINFLDYAHKHKDTVKSISTVTNGSLLTNKILDKLAEYERFNLTISVNATERIRYREVHNRDLWEHIYSLLSNWQGCRERLRVSFVLDANSIEDGRTFQKFWRNLGYSIRFVPIFARVDTMKVNSYVHPLDNNYGHCHYPVDTLNVLADGSVILCCHDWQHSQQFGNLNNRTISEIWNSAELTSLRRDAIEGTLRNNGMCRNCDYPIRSSQRVRLEALVKNDPAIEENTKLQEFPIHVTSIRSAPNGSSIPVLVWKINEKSGTIVAFINNKAEIIPRNIWFRFHISYSEVFDYGALEPVWCPAIVSEIKTNVDIIDTTQILIQLDQQAEEFQFFHWYCSDWIE